MEKVLEMKNITMQFGGVVAVNNLSLEVHKGEIVSLIGPNGAGKTTAFNVITGVYAPTNGAVYFNEKEIVENYPRGKMKKLYAGSNRGDFTKHLEPTPDKITKLGIARTFQNIRLWKSQTVFTNVLIAKHMRRSSNVFTATFRLNLKEEKKQREETEELLKILGLYEVRNELCTSLPYGLQRRLEIARALATQAPVILADEPTANLDSKNSEQILLLMQKLNLELSTTFIFSTHDQRIVNMCNHVIYILDGREIDENLKNQEADS